MDRERTGIDNSEGIAYGLIFLILFIFVAACTVVIVYELENTLFTEIINPFIQAGTMSQQTSNAINFQRNIGLGLPIVALLGGLIWSFMRGFGSRDGNSTGVSSGSFYTGWVILISLCLIGFLMSFLGGTIIDKLYSSLDSANMIQGTMVSDEWNAAQAGTMWGFINSFYALCYLCPILGLIIFVKSVVVRTYGDRYYGGY